MTERQEKPIKAKLVVKLFAANVVVAESEDEKLWQNVLGAITSGNPTVGNQRDLDQTPKLDPAKDPLGGKADSPIAKLANELDVPVETVQGACAPTDGPPFIRLDDHYWEAFKKAIPARGKGSLGPLALPATLLCLWFKHSNLGGATPAQALAVLKTINQTDQNTSRSIKNCEWLQSRDGKIFINPAETSRAIIIARVYCLKQASQGEKK